MSQTPPISPPTARVTAAVLNAAVAGDVREPAEHQGRPRHHQEADRSTSEGFRIGATALSGPTPGVVIVVCHRLRSPLDR